MSVFSDYFTDQSIDFNAFIDELSTKINSRFFDISQVIDITLDVTDNSTYDYTLLDYGDYHIQMLYTGQPTHYDENSLSINPTPLTMLTTNGSTYTPTDTFQYARQGKYLLLKNTASARTLHIRAKVVLKDNTTIKDQIYRRLEELYYFLLVKDIDGIYRSLRALSDEKKNCIAQNIHLRPKRKLRTIQYSGISLRT